MLRLDKEKIMEAASCCGFHDAKSPNNTASVTLRTAEKETRIIASVKRGLFHLEINRKDILKELEDMSGVFIDKNEYTITVESEYMLRVVLLKIKILSINLPNHPEMIYKERCEHELIGVKEGTETERIIRARIGQDIFRKILMEYWEGKCPVTGLNQTEILRASHIIPWSECIGTERLNVYNGILLSADWDAAFDKHLVSFDDKGSALFSVRLSENASRHLKSQMAAAGIRLMTEHLSRIATHRSRMADLDNAAEMKDFSDPAQSS